MYDVVDELDEVVDVELIVDEDDELELPVERNSACETPNGVFESVQDVKSIS